MSMWIKICGNTSLADARLVADAGADAVGFVFAPSPRRVTIDQVAAITARLPDSVEKIGVFVDAPFEEITATVRRCGLTGVQVHFVASQDLTRSLRGEFGGRLRILRVLHYGEHVGEQAAELWKDENVDALLVDSRTAQAVGGTGVAFNWESAARSLGQSSGGGRRLVVAGGLTPLNVPEAIGTLRPWGVDVVSGVELSPGQKDAARVKSFIASARAVASGPDGNR